MLEFLSKLLDISDFQPRWSCGNWTAEHGWLHILSDCAIFGAYAAIPAVLVFFVLRRRDIPFPPIFWLFAGFILFCGTGHLIEATLYWQPWYRLSGIVKLATAAISWATVFALIRVMPKALLLPSLARMNETLQKEIQERDQAQRLLQSAQNELERRVRERTRELEQANSRLQEEVAVRTRAEEELRQSAEHLERFNGLAVGRELRIIELKRRVNELAQQLGSAAPFDLSFAAEEQP